MEESLDFWGIQLINLISLSLLVCVCWRGSVHSKGHIYFALDVISNIS